MPHSALITGGASGIGLATARRLAASGTRVALVDLDADRAAEAAATCGPHALGLAADVTDRDAIAGALERAAEAFGGLDAVVANAGVGYWGTVATIDPGLWERNVEVNLLGVWRTVRAAIPHVTRRRGYLLLTASMAATLGPPGMSAYAVSKAGTEALGRSLRVEMAPRGVAVGVAYYSFIGTPMVAEADEHPGFARLRRTQPGPLRRAYPVEAAAAATAAGIERRARRVVYPRWNALLLAARGLLDNALTDRDLVAVMPELDAITEAEIARHGAQAALPPRRRAAAGR